MSRKLVSARPVAPGRILKRELEARGWSQKDLAAILDRPEQALSEIVQGRKQITPETALALGKAFGTSPELWLNLETRYRLALAARSAGDDLVERRSRLYSLVPVRELRRRGWISDVDDAADLEQEVKRLLGVASLDEPVGLTLAARRTATKSPDQGALLAWVRRVEQLAARVTARPFDRARLQAGMAGVLALTAREDRIAELPRLLAGLGVRLVIVPHLPGTSLDGALLLDEAGPIVALTLRYDRLDSFWFTLLHELEHLLQGHSGGRLEDLDAAPAGDADEGAADHAAAERLVPDEQLAAFVARVTPFFSKASIESFAASIDRHPAIVLGRLQHDDHVPPAHLRKTIPPVRRWLAPWVDVAEPVAAPTPPGRVAEVAATPYGAQQATEAVLTFLRTHPGWHGKAAIVAGSRLPSSVWQAAIAALVTTGDVERIGDKRGAKYRAKG